MPAEAISALVLATRNPHKLAEFSRLLAPAGIAVEPLPDDVTLPPEDGETFAENALPKARSRGAGDRPAGRSPTTPGIEAEALGGAPGVRSARYAGPHATDQENLDKLLREAPAGSGLRYVCALAYVDPADGRGADLLRRLHAAGWPQTPRGSGGFGYDPAFLPDEDDGERTMAELTEAEKDAISHRGDAVRALLEWLNR